MKKPLSLAIFSLALFLVSSFAFPGISFAAAPYALEKIDAHTYQGVLRSSQKSGYYIENGFKVPLHIAGRGDLAWMVDKKVRLVIDGEITRFSIKSLNAVGDGKVYSRGYIPPSEKSANGRSASGGSSNGGMPQLVSSGPALPLMFASLLLGLAVSLSRKPQLLTDVRRWFAFAQ